MIAPAPTASAASAGVPLMRAIESLSTAAETRSGYERSKFRLWVDADRDCQDTRDEVLAAESLVRVHGCDIQTGKWRSYYDGVGTRSSTAFDIDHLVPLAEAWDSGARGWSADTRERYANDLGDPRTLVAVSAGSNRSKSDKDPAEWMPAHARCRYVRQWVAVKLRWSLTVDPTERRALLAQGSPCSNSLITVRLARLVRAGSTSAATTTSTSTANVGLDPRFAYCYQAIAAGYGPYSRGRDAEYAWYTDGDSDGMVCES
jgi:hypothetical protein